MNHLGLEDGDIVIFFNRKIGVYIEKFNSFVLEQGGWIKATEYKSLDERTMNEWESSYDILKVLRPKEDYGCRFDIYEDAKKPWYDVIYDRASVKSMTLEEVEKELGYKIRIVG